MPSRLDRWSQYDEAEYRTGGMERVGYDADTQRYYFQEGTELYEGEPGAEFGGQLRHVGRAPARMTAYPPTAADAAAARDSLGWRQLAPFLTIIFVLLLLLLRYFSPYYTSTPPPPPPVEGSQCEEAGLVVYKVVQGDSCWSIANARGWDVERLQRANGHH
ncbi:hypothetical protein FRC17_008361, partial [Serendipita sp. 399]